MSDDNGWAEFAAAECSPPTKRDERLHEALHAFVNDGDRPNGWTAERLAWIAAAGPLTDEQRRRIVDAIVDALQTGYSIRDGENATAANAASSTRATAKDARYSAIAEYALANPDTREQEIADHFRVHIRTVRRAIKERLIGG
jgi:hypothetical protein